ncbi:MAG: Alanine-tRNA ligase [Candidatus Shapirobacteria bacterium GW2011_GWF1_38_23]|nr:MAG: Alanine-tRNA ligase [Candidatus Shapirobacteria bacterium GW2011_GWF1_38_23]HBP51484.1 alanine--tRNA ligase [Candidatus Shapirobacteria bacterium]
MNARELKNIFIEFFLKKKHVEIPSAMLVPENDPTTLFISAGIQPLVPFFLGKKHPSGDRLVNVQKCVRTGDIEEVGDAVHHTFFEMLGNWSLGDYFKQEMIPWSFEFLTKTLNIPQNKLAVSVFAGDQDAPKDEETAKLWEKQGIPLPRIAYLPKENNWWGPPGITGPCGTDTEMFYWTGDNQAPEVFDPKDNRWVEIWNDVLIQYLKNNQGKYEQLVQNNIDTGMGVERTTAVLSGFSDNYLTNIWQPIIKEIENISTKKYSENLVPMRIIADHLRAAIFMIADGVEPSNKERGYVLRRLIRRSIRQGKIIGIENNFCSVIAQAVLDNQDNYAGTYPELDLNENKILETLEAEETKFRRTLNKGLNEIEKDFINYTKLFENKKQEAISAEYLGKKAFYYFESFGFPVEMFLDEASFYKTIIKMFDRDEIIKYFNIEKQKHTEQSRTLSAGKFKSGLADHSEVITKYHTTTHLLHAALRKVLGDHVQQGGSNITSERLRFDFSHQEKVSETQLKEVEKIVNDQIKLSLPVSVESMKFIDAQKSGALAFFGAKYPEIVTVYTVGNPKGYFSKEICTGPHVENIGKLGSFEILKEESAGSGKRRIYAILK